MRETLTNPRATGGAANWANTQLRSQIPAVGKTGTSQNNRDLGFSGSTPYFTASIWMGNDNNQRMHPNTRSEHTRAWRSIMEEIHQELPPRQFYRPNRIVSVTICRDSGLLPSELCNRDPRGTRTRTDIFDARFVPTETCCTHQEMTFCTLHGHLTGPFCPPDYTVTRVGIVRQNPISNPAANVWDRHIELPAGALAGIVCPYHMTPPIIINDWPWDTPRYGPGSVPDDAPGHGSGSTPGDVPPQTQAPPIITLPPPPPPFTNNEPDYDYENDYEYDHDYGYDYDYDSPPDEEPDDLP